MITYIFDKKKLSIKKLSIKKLSIKKVIDKKVIDKKVIDKKVIDKKSYRYRNIVLCKKCDFQNKIFNSRLNQIQIQTIFSW